MLQTQRLYLRRWNKDDLDDLYEYAKNPKVGISAGWKPHQSREESALILSKFIQSDELWAIVEKCENKVIGCISLEQDSKRDNQRICSLGYGLSEAYWGKGLMTEAVKCLLQYGFEELDLDLISVRHYPFNQRSRRVIEKCGFRYEGTLRQSARLFDGEVYDDCCYSLTKEEYIRMKASQNEDKELMNQVLALHALQSRELAYAPYSNFLVGAALLCEDGSIYLGSNIENGAYTPSNCAERTAFFTAVQEGKREFSAIAVAGGKREEKTLSQFCAPCGVCLQVMLEFCDPQTFEIILVKNEFEYEVHLLKEMIPFGFQLNAHKSNR